jgi:hypothetical protein
MAAALGAVWLGVSLMLKPVDRPTVAQTMPAALEWLWKGYPIP